MKLITVTVALFTAWPVCAESPLYTNADLGKPLTRTHTVAPAQLASLAARQFAYVPPVPPGPQVIILNSSPTAGPFGEFAPFEFGRSMDGLPYFNPYWGLNTYWEPNVGPGWRGRSGSPKGMGHSSRQPGQPRAPRGGGGRNR
jgi:hypothetical protein